MVALLSKSKGLSDVSRYGGGGWFSSSNKRLKKYSHVWHLKLLNAQKRNSWLLSCECYTFFSYYIIFLITHYGKQIIVFFSTLWTIKVFSALIFQITYFGNEDEYKSLPVPTNQKWENTKRENLSNSFGLGFLRSLLAGRPKPLNRRAHVWLMKGYLCRNCF